MLDSFQRAHKEVHGNEILVPTNQVENSTTFYKISSNCCAIDTHLFLALPPAHRILSNPLVASEAYSNRRH